MRILIVGGGIAGLTLANLLRQQGETPLIIEREPAWSAAGYALGLWSLGSGVFKKIGLYREFIDASIPLVRYDIANHSGRVLRSFKFERLFRSSDSIRMILRSELLKLLASPLSEGCLRMNTTSTSITQSEAEVRVAFSDGTSGVFDLVIGCDGIHSQTRREVFGQIPLRRTGWGGWAWWIDPSLTPPGVVTEQWGLGRFFGLYPARNALFCLFGAPESEIEGDPHSIRLDFIREKFRSLGGAAPGVLETLDKDKKPTFWEFSDLHLEDWYRGRVLLMGDACNAILPTAGVGASCAIESAALFAKEFSAWQKPDLAGLLKRYEAACWPRVREFQSGSKDIARIVFLRSGFLCLCRNLILRVLPEKLMFAGFGDLVKSPVWPGLPSGGPRHGLSDRTR